MNPQENKSHLSQSALIALAEEALVLARNQGADAAEVSLHTESGFSVTAWKGDAENLEHHNEKGIALTVYFGQRTASTSTTDFSTETLQAIVDKACAIAGYTHEDPYAGLPEANFQAHDYPDLSLSHPWDITPAIAIERVIACEALALQADPRIQQSDHVGLNSHQSRYVYANSNGFSGSYPYSRHSLSCGVLAKEADKMQQGSEYTVSCCAADLQSNPWMVERAVKKAIDRLSARGLSTRQCPVLLEAPVARSFWRILLSAISGGHLYRRSSFLCDHLDKQILPSTISVWQEPYLKGALGSVPFDDEGVRVDDRNFVSDGILRSYLLSSYSGRKLNLETTGNAGGVHNLLVTESELDFDGLLKKMGRGLWVTQLMGHGVNLTTGDYSQAALGYWVEGGEVQYAVDGITIAGNLKDMFANLVAVANDTDCRGSIRSGSVLLESMTIAG